MPASWKALNPLPNMLSRQWTRLPDWIKGILAGLAYAEASDATNSHINRECER